MGVSCKTLFVYNLNWHEYETVTSRKILYAISENTLFPTVSLRKYMEIVPNMEEKWYCHSYRTKELTPIAYNFLSTRTSTSPKILQLMQM